MEFYKLSKKTKELLDELLSVENPVVLLVDKFKKASHQEDEELRCLLEELKKNEFIKIKFADDKPSFVIITYHGKTYNEQLEEYEKELETKKEISYNIGTVNNQNGVFAIGNISDSNIFINNTIKKLEDEIESKGGEDKEALYSLLNETKEIIDNFNATGQIPKHIGFTERLSSHLKKHDWFYREIVSLIGTIVIKLF